MPRRRVPFGRGSYNVMAASWAEKGVVGHKTYAAGAGGVSGHVMLYSTEGKGLLAVIEASRMGQVRTGAASGVASKHMARKDAKSVGIIGAGYQAATQLEAIAAVRGIESANVYSRTAEKRDAFAATMSRKLGIDVHATASAADAVKGMDIVATITNSADPVLTGEMLEPGMHINAAGGNSWMRRELDTAAVIKCGKVVADDVDQARMECGELMRAAEAGRFYWDTLVSLDKIAGGLLPGRDDNRQITLFESQGVALEDIAVCERLYRLAVERKVGSKLPV
jgi:ornithine cyclodeaminase/alanine dehydrogenase-like protein (mu-crystallin family)